MAQSVLVSSSMITKKTCHTLILTDLFPLWNTKMSETSNNPVTNQEAPHAAELMELAALIETLPDEFKQYFQPAMERAMENVDRRRRILSFIQEALSQLRLDMKYLMFDLEATRRERDEYREKLEGTS